MMADPGCISCPECNETFWHEADVLKCTERGCEFGAGLPRDISPPKPPGIPDVHCTAHVDYAPETRINMDAIPDKEGDKP